MKKLLVLAAVFCPMLAFGQSTINPIINAFLVNDGSLTPITQGMQVRSGDLVEYHAYLPNQSSERIRSMTVTLEIPAGVSFVQNIEPITVTASVDNVRFGHIPLQTQVNGQIQNVPKNLYRSLRYTVEDVGIGGVAVVKYQAYIN